MTEKIKSLLPFAVILIVSFGVAFAIGFQSREKIAEPKAAAAPTEGALSDLEVRSILLRELAKSSDEISSKKNEKGLCGLNFEELGQVMRATQADIDSSKTSEQAVNNALAKFQTCAADCLAALCSSKVFSDLDSRKQNYGSASDGM